MTRRTARLNRDSNGEPVGVALMLGVNDLELLGVEIETVDNVEYFVNDDGIHIIGASERDKITRDRRVVDDD